MACLRMKWKTHLVVDGHAKVDESKHRHIHKDTLGNRKWNEQRTSSCEDIDLGRDRSIAFNEIF